MPPEEDARRLEHEVEPVLRRVRPGVRLRFRLLLARPLAVRRICLHLLRLRLSRIGDPRVAPVQWTLGRRAFVGRNQAPRLGDERAASVQHLLLHLFAVFTSAVHLNASEPTNTQLQYRTGLKRRDEQKLLDTCSRRNSSLRSCGMSSA